MGTPFFREMKQTDSGGSQDNFFLTPRLIIGNFDAQHMDLRQLFGMISWECLPCGVLCVGGKSDTTHGI